MFALIITLSACGESDIKTDESTTKPSVGNPKGLQELGTVPQNTSPSPPAVDDSLPDESLKVETIHRKGITSEEVGVVMYPEAIRVDERTWKTGDIDTHGIQTMTMVVLFTKDTFAKVATYYRTALSPNKADIFDVDRGAQGKLMSLTTSNRDQSSTNVLLTEIKKESEQGTQIKITRMAVLDDSVQSKSLKQSETN